MSLTLAESIFGTPDTLRLYLALLFAGLLIAAALNDLRRRTIPNALVFSGALLAVVLHFYLPAGDGFFSALPGGLGGLQAIQGLLYGLLVMLPLYLWLGFGAGDVKLMAMIGAFLGPVQIWPAMMVSLLAGGILAVILMLNRGEAGFRLKTGPAIQEASAQIPLSQRLPYALAVALGVIAYLGFQAARLGLL